MTPRCPRASGQMTGHGAGCPTSIGTSPDCDLLVRPLGAFFCAELDVEWFGSWLSVTLYAERIGAIGAIETAAGEWSGLRRATSVVPQHEILHTAIINTTKLDTLRKTKYTIIAHLKRDTRLVE